MKNTLVILALLGIGIKASTDSWNVYEADASTAGTIDDDYVCGNDLCSNCDYWIEA